MTGQHAGAGTRAAGGGRARGAWPNTTPWAVLAAVLLAGCGTEPTATQRVPTASDATLATASDEPRSDRTSGTEAHDGTIELSPSETPPVTDPEPTRADTPDAEAGRLDNGVIVDLAVDWRPENELDEEEVAAQRERIRQAEDAVLEALGPHGRVRRRLHATAQVSLAVDEDGLRILHDLPQVAAVHEDTADPPN